MFRKKKLEKKTYGDRRVLRDLDNRIVVDMTVSDDTDFLSVFSEKLTPVISTEVAAFIEDCTAAISPREQLTLRIHSNCIDDREKEIYRSAISDYYKKQYAANEIERKRNNLIAFLLSVVGMGTLLLEAFLEFTDHRLWTEVIDIVAWVLLWEAVDISIFRNEASRMRRKRCSAYIAMKIEYVSIEEQAVQEQEF